MPASIVYLEVVAFVIIAIIFVAILMKKRGDKYASLWDRKWKNPLKGVDPEPLQEAAA